MGVLRRRVAARRVVPLAPKRMPNFLLKLPQTERTFAALRLVFQISIQCQRRVSTRSRLRDSPTALRHGVRDAQTGSNQSVAARRGTCRQSRPPAADCCRCGPRTGTAQQPVPARQGAAYISGPRYGWRARGRGRTQGDRRSPQPEDEIFAMDREISAATVPSAPSSPGRPT